MKKLIGIYSLVLTIFIFLASVTKAEDKKYSFGDHELNFFSGMFDFSDKGKRSVIIGFQHQNESLFRE